MNSENYETENKAQIPQRNRNPRLKWTKELHQIFEESVNRLGGAYEATPRNIVKMMDTKGITPNHIKSHLQKYRQSKAAENGIDVMPSKAYQGNEYGTTLAWQTHYKETQMPNAQKLSTEALGIFKNHSEKSENFQQQVPCSQGKNLIAALGLERIAETSKADERHSEKAKSKKVLQLCEPVRYQSQIHSLQSSLTFSRVGTDQSDSDTARLVMERKKELHKNDDAMWLAAIEKDRPFYLSLTDGDGNVEQVEAGKKFANDCIGLQLANDLGRFSAHQVNITRAESKSRLSSLKESGFLHSSRESNSNYQQSIDLNISMLDEPFGKQ